MFLSTEKYYGYVIRKYILLHTKIFMTLHTLHCVKSQMLESKKKKKADLRQFGEKIQYTGELRTWNDVSVNQPQFSRNTIFTTSKATDTRHSFS